MSPVGAAVLSALEGGTGGHKRGGEGGREEEEEEGRYMPWGGRGTVKYLVAVYSVTRFTGVSLW